MQHDEFARELRNLCQARFEAVARGKHEPDLALAMAWGDTIFTIVAEVVTAIVVSSGGQRAIVDVLSPAVADSLQHRVTDMFEEVKNMQSEFDRQKRRGLQ